MRWEAGRRDQAIAHWQELLRLNPNDNQGIRDILVPRLIEQRRDQEAETVLAAYADDNLAMLSHARALVEFRRSGDGEAAQAQLAVAMRGNPHVAKYLTGATPIPEGRPATYRPAQEEASRRRDLHGPPGASEGASVAALLTQAAEEGTREQRRWRRPEVGATVPNHVEVHECALRAGLPPTVSR
jgi:tetratricopeptide (TPR) repeat protein